MTCCFARIMFDVSPCGSGQCFLRFWFFPEHNDLKNESPVRKNSKIDIVNMRYENTRKQKEKPEQIAKV